jgi:hypothetical protein
VVYQGEQAIFVRDDPGAEETSHCEDWEKNFGNVIE